MAWRLLLVTGVSRASRCVAIGVRIGLDVFGPGLSDKKINKVAELGNNLTNSHAFRITPEIINMKIGIVTEYFYPTLGGITENIYHFSRELLRAGHDFRIITGKTATPENVEPEIRER